MAGGYTYPAPQLPLNGTEQFTIFQEQSGQLETCTVTAAQMAAYIDSPQANAGYVVAAGTNQGTAAALTHGYNVAVAVAANSGVIFSSSFLTQTFLNRGANTALVYPPVGSQLESIGTNAPISVLPKGSVTGLNMGSGQWYIV